MNMLKAYLWNLLIAVDQLLNTLTFGDPDETLSSRMGKRVHRCKLCRAACRLLHRFDPNHCEKTIEHDEGKDEIKL